MRIREEERERHICKLAPAGNNKKIFYAIFIAVSVIVLMNCKNNNEIKAIVIGAEYIECIVQFSIVDTIYNDSIKEFMKIVNRNGIHYIEDIKANKLKYGDTIVNGRVRVFLDNVKIGEYYMIDGELEGACTTWYPNGRIQSKCYYINSKMNGDYIFWDGEGEISTKINYKDGVPVSAYHKQQITP